MHADRSTREGPVRLSCSDYFYASCPVLSGVCFADEQAQGSHLLACKGSWHIA